MAAPGPVASADGDFAAVLPAGLAAAAPGRSLVIGWLSRGDGAPLELITTVGPADPGGTATAGSGASACWPAPPARYELDVLVPLLAGSAELGSRPYRLRSGTGA